ncbi:V-type proton ATPase 116 kDa subunit a1 [Papilio machaon]|uniref:V-type proton ATPase 116 kDa subunit a1 n=1 Tax=Papilio machaon TaxID=76193 RepID=UPI001E662EA6|nr:V-type proton ATPase 116 kDa subunit a1 [Papilio machaon]
MTGMVRSEEMVLCDVYLQPEAAFDIVSRFGEMGCLQFLDANPDVKPYERNYVAEVCRCAEMERRLRYMEGEMRKDSIKIPGLDHDPPALQPHEMSQFENSLEKWEADILDMSENQTNLLNNYLELREMSYLLTQIGPLLGDAELSPDTLLSRKGGGETATAGRLVVLSGVVHRNRSYPFQMMLWRVSRGNIYYRQASEDAILLDPSTGKDIRKVAFLAICQGEQLSSRMEKVCAGFRVNVYPCPETKDERLMMTMKLYTRVSDLEQVIKKTKYHRCKALRTVGKRWALWMMQVRKSKSIYHTMNMFSLDITKNCLIGQCWVPKSDLERVNVVLAEVSAKIGTNVPSFISKTETSEVPPTYFRTNRFTNGFQTLINAYGDSKYRELNPGLYTIITFPFLFAIMFGDFGHGCILILFSGWMILTEKKHMGIPSGNEIWNIMFGGRYVIFLMGIFSAILGILYNDIFSKHVYLMESYWKNTFTLDDLQASPYITLDPALDTNRPYAFGVDPFWGFATNSIMNGNSMKMKMSIIIGIIHMIFGLTLSLFNHLYFKRYYAIYLQFIPQVLFLCCIFLWLVILIYMKWFMFSGKATDVKRGPGCAPLILILFIDMALFTTSKPVDKDCDAYMFESQQSLQKFLLIIALLCVPILFFGTPLYIYVKNQSKRKELLKSGIHSKFRKYQHGGSVSKSEERMNSEIAKYSVPLGEILIHQAIHSIEFTLSTVSHTASYLRLWALSLAHQQLSKMLWSMIMAKLALKDHSSLAPVKIFAIFAVWAIFTVSILVVMEGLSAFLHTLRLHWVEFMSKFFEGEGYCFRPFNFKELFTKDKDSGPEASCKKRAVVDI